jgi:putative ABC transport system substrate-binding protein
VYSLTRPDGPWKPADLVRQTARLLAALTVGFLVTAQETGGQQPPGVARLGVLISGPRATYGTNALQDGLAELGWVEGRNLVIEARFADDRAEERLVALAAELMRANVQVIFAANHVAARAMKGVNGVIPIVSIGALAPLVGSLARPQGNVTGLVAIPPESSGKQIELLKEAAPKISRVAYFVESPPGNPQRAARAAAIGRSLGLTVHSFGVRTADEIEAALRDALGLRVDALAIGETPFLVAHRARITDFVAKHRLPAVSTFSGFPESGFLMSYGTNLPQLYRRAAYYVDRLLKGAKPADLPVEQPTKFDLVVNLRTAKTLGLTIPPSVLQRADRVIE